MYFPYLFKFLSREAKEILANCQVDLPDDCHFGGPQKRVVGQNRPGNGVFDRHNGVFHFSLLQHDEHVAECLTGDRLVPAAEILCCCLIVKRPGDPLDGNVM